MDRRRLGQAMTFFKALSNSLMGALRKTNAYDIDVIRQNTPPDERDMQASEETPVAAGQTYADRGRKMDRMNILAPLILGMLEILPYAECDILLSSF
jgi:hypothetical protein